MTDATGLERNWWNRVYFYSSLYDFDDHGSSLIRTSKQKFITQGKVALIRLQQLQMLTQDEAELCSTSIISRVDPSSMNAAALALAFTTYDSYTQQFLVQPDTNPALHANIRAVQKQKCFKTLVAKLSSGSSSPLAKFQQEFGITPADLVRYFLFLQKHRSLVTD